MSFHTTVPRTALIAPNFLSKFIEAMRAQLRC
jgi:hypothetical protein